MVCNSLSYEEETVRDKQRAADRQRRDAYAAHKIAAFFTNTFGKGAVLGPCPDNRPNKIQLVGTFPGCIMVHHRGYEIFADCSHAADAETQFRAWCTKEMPHARLPPKIAAV